VITAAARRFIHERIAPVVTAAGWTWTPPGGSSEPRLFDGLAWGGASFPYVVIQILSPGNDLHTQNGNDIWSDPIYLVKAVTEGTDTEDIEPVVDAIDEALHNARGYVTGGRVLECWRERRHELFELNDGRTFTNSGAEYRMKIVRA
jgi:hypothetical protein